MLSHLRNMATNKTPNSKIAAALGEIPADLLLKNARYLNFFSQRIEQADILIQDGTIVGIGDNLGQAKKIIDCTDYILAPGFIDAHIHLESTLLSPQEYANVAIKHGTSAIIADPHELANVAGIKGIEWIYDATEDLPVDVYVMLPSCVPASNIQDNFGPIHAEDLHPFYSKPRVLGLAEMMNVPGVLTRDSDVIRKIVDSPFTDGHSPLLLGKALNAYLAAGVRTDHECSSLEEAREKLFKGMWVHIRDGSAAKNLKALVPLLKEPYWSRISFCTDDKHPDDLSTDGEIDAIVRKAIAYGVDCMRAYMCASYNPAMCYGLKDRGAIAIGAKADILFLDPDLSKVKVLSSLHNGVRVEEAPHQKPDLPEEILHSVHTSLKAKEDFQNPDTSWSIEMVPGELLTRKISYNKDDKDLCLLGVFSRYHESNKHALCYLSGFGLKEGAIATSVAHDSHNIIVVGKNIDDMVLAVNRVIKEGGGMYVYNNGQEKGGLPLDIAGLMSSLPHEKVEEHFKKAKRAAQKMGVSKRFDPFMNLSFLALPVIPEIRLTSEGLVVLK